VAYLNGSKVLTTGSALTFDGFSAGSLNVGSISGSKIKFPRFSDNSTVLEITSLSTVNELEMRNGSGGGENYLKVGNGYLAFGAATSEQMRLTSTGLGIGTSSPNARLEVIPGGTGEVRIGTGTNAASSRLALTFYDRYGSVAGGQKTAFVESVRNGDGADWSLAFGTGNAAGVNAVEKMRLNSSGNLGIGTSNPNSRLTVDSGSAGIYGFFNSANASGGYMSFASSGTFQADIGTASQIVSGGSTSNFGINVRGANSLIFGTNSTERMRLDSSGNLGLGVTPSAWNSYKASQINDGAVADISNNQIIVSKNAFYDSSNWRYINSNFASFYQQFSGQHRWHTAPSGTAGNAITFTQAATLTANGEYLVGLTSATGVAKLQVSGPIRTTGYTVATLPAGTVGMRTYVTDALAPSFGVAVAGSGAVTIPVFYDGANWIVA
jgi:hypothetical protein